MVYKPNAGLYLPAILAWIVCYRFGARERLRESWRLLLASASSAHPNGLANSSGLVGRNLMLHPLASVVGLFDEDFEGWRAQNGVLIHSHEFATSDASRGFVRGATSDSES